MFAIGVAAFAGLWAYSVLSRKTPAQQLAALQAEVKPKGGIVFETTLNGKPLVFLVQSCKVYLLDASAKRVERTQVLRTGFYFGLDVCGDQSIGAEGEYVNVFLSTQAIGAGGGNTTGGNYRSKDGVAWEKKTEKGWLPVDQAQ